MYAQGAPIPAHVSRAIRIAGVWSIILVVILHAGNERLALGYAFDTIAEAARIFIVGFFSGEIARVAVPVFFAISGYLLLPPAPVRSQIDAAILKRARTVLAPFLLWSALCFAAFYALQAFGPTRGLFGNNIVYGLSPLDMLRRWLIDPVPYQLWFLRDLCLLVLFSPLLLRAVVRMPVVLFIIEAAVWLWADQQVAARSPNGVLFFSIGLYLRQHQIDIDFSRKDRLLPATWLIVAAAATLAKMADVPYPAVLSKLGIAIGVLALWQLVCTAEARTLGRLERFARYSFPVFLLHEPLMTLIKKLMLKLFAPLGAGAAELALYFITPLVTIAICIAIARMFAAVSPSAYRLFMGGRG